jgi:hypothetical protein
VGERIKFTSQITEIQKINPYCSRVLIKIAYDGLNRNNSYIARSTFDAAEYSLPRCMILGEYSETVEDFRGHGGKIEITDDSIKWVNTTIPYGFIDVDTEITWQEVIEEDGTAKNYICATGYVWTGRYPELEDLILNSKSQSMEIDVISSQDKVVDGVECVEITEFVYMAFTILGDDIEPCFESSTISAYSLDTEKFKMDFARMVAELKFSLSETYNVVETVMVNNPVEMWKCPHCKDFIGEKELYFNNEKWYHSPCIDKGEIQFNKKSLQSDVISSAKVLQEGGTELDKVLELLQKDFSLEELEAKVVEVFEVNVEPLAEDVSPTFEELPATEFTLTSNQLEDELRRELCEIETLTEVWYDEVYTSPRYYYRDCKPDQNVVIAMDEKNWYLVGFTFSVNGDNVEIDAASLVRYKLDYNPMDLASDTDGEQMIAGFMSQIKSDFMLSAKEKSLTKQFEVDKEVAVSEANTKLAELQIKFDELQAKYALTDSELAAKLQAERESSEETIFDSFSKSLTEEEMADVKTKKSDFSLQEIEEKLCVILGRKAKVTPVANFSKVEETVKPLRYSIIDTPQVKIASDKSYADIIIKKDAE